MSFLGDNSSLVDKKLMKYVTNSVCFFPSGSRSFLRDGCWPGSVCCGDSCGAAQTSVLIKCCQFTCKVNYIKNLSYNMTFLLLAECNDLSGLYWEVSPFSSGIKVLQMYVGLAFISTNVFWVGIYYYRYNLYLGLSVFIDSGISKTFI